jgi:hypothetical protein
MIISLACARLRASTEWYSSILASSTLKPASLRAQLAKRKTSFPRMEERIEISFSPSAKRSVSSKFMPYMEGIMEEKLGNLVTDSATPAA